MQCRKLDRHRRRFQRGLPAGRRADDLDCATIGFVVAQGIGRRAGGFPEHVEGMSIAVFLGGDGPVQGLVDGAPHDELPPENAHGRDDGLTDDRLADAADQAPQGAPEILLGAVEMDDVAGKHQGPGSGIDERAV